MGKAFIFDIDGTLLDTERIYVASWKQAAAERGYVMPDSLMARTRSVAGAIGQQMMLETMGQDFPIDEIRQRRFAIAEEAIPKDPSLLKPGARELLLELRRLNIPFAAATSTGKSHTQAHLAAAGLDQILTKRVTGDMVTHGKPAPDIFLKAAELLGIAPEDCLVVEDSRAGLAAAAAAGMKALWVPDLNSVPNPGEADCFRHYQSLTELLAELPQLLEENA